MVARKFLVRHRDSDFDVDYDTDDGFDVFKFQLFSLTSIPPDEQKIFGGDGDRLVLSDSDLASVTERLQLMSVDEETKEEEKSGSFDDELVISDEEFARMLQAEEEALMLQQYAAGGGEREFEQRIRPYVTQVLMYEDASRQEAARKTVPVEKLEEKALVALAKEGNFKHSKSEQELAFLLQLLFWFKQSFRWVNAPPCDGCGNETIGEGMAAPLDSETFYGASRVELYRCNACSRITRFPRYNDPQKLLETRRGRCGEWANCFTLYCRAFGYESRLILDFTDHVWTECFSPFLGRWMHLDPCEGIYDNPLLYEKGWKKNLNYLIAIAKDGVYDVTKRYTRKWYEVLSRRNITTEPVVSTVLANITRDCRKNLTSQMLSALEERDRNEAQALESSLHSNDDTSISLPGRLSGDKEWRISRAEFGSDESCSLSFSSCPVRKCIDEHVTKVYNAFCPIIFQFVENSSFKSRAVEVLKIFRRILIDLKNSPFRTRRTSINSGLEEMQFFVHQMLPSFSELFNALSLKSEFAKGRLDIYLADDPVKTSIAFPVVFHALDDVIYHINNCDNLNKDALCWPLLKLNRLCSGFVLASGEELPFGIATSAFDGTRMSKWEEPNGARGRLLEAKYPHLYWSPCAAHCIDLMLEDIGNLPNIKRTLQRAITLSGYIYNRPGLLNMMRHFTSCQELVRPAKTRFATCFITLSSIHRQKSCLRKMFTSEEWCTSKWAKERQGKRAAEIILMPSFWNIIVYSLKVTGPLVRVLRLVDGEKKPSMGYIYEAMDRAKEAIAKSFQENEEKYKEVFEIIDRRWEIQLHRPLHAAGYVLNPEFFYAHPNIDQDVELMDGYIQCMERLAPNFDVLDAINLEFPRYRNADGLFGRISAIRQRSLKAPGCWLIYSVLGNQMHELVAYELMSANDAPERDPMDWVVEGSDDAGSNWHVLDKQASQMFENRFERKAFKIGSPGFPSNAFRFRFTAVRDIERNSRFQIGSIDLYTRGGQCS